MERDTDLLQEHITSHHTARLVGGAVLATSAFFTMGAAVGAHTPSTVEIGPGITVDASLQAEPQTDIDLGALGEVTVPGARYAGFGAHIRVHPIEVNTKEPQSLGFYAALQADPAHSIKEPIINSIRTNALIGGGIGIGAEIGLGAGLFAYRRKKLDTSASMIEKAASLQRAAPNNAEVLAIANSLRSTKTPRLAPKIAASCFSFAVLAGYQGDVRVPETAAHGTAITPVLTERFSLLEGATIRGNGAELLINTGANQVNNYIEKTNAFYAEANKNLTKAFETIQYKKDDIRLGDPQYVTVMAISDIHFNRAMLEKLTGNIIKQGSADLIVNLGDFDTSLGEQFYEKESANTLAKALDPAKIGKRVHVVSIIGNHDSELTAERQRVAKAGTGDLTFKPFIVLDKDHPNTVQDGLLFSSGPFDPRQSGFGRPMTPADPFEQKEAVRAQGHEIADNACELTKESSTKPVVLAHDREATYEAILRNCAGMAMSGHAHKQTLPAQHELLTDNGDTIVTFTQGSSAGAGPQAITQYSPPSINAPYTFFMFDRLTNQPVGYYNVVVHTNAKVTLSSYKKLPAVTSLPDEILAAYPPLQ